MNYDIYKNTIPTPAFEFLKQAMLRFDINSSLRCSHFLAQAGHESAGFKVTTENLNYSETGLLKVFPKYFTKETSVAYGRNPGKIASRVYANRMGNDNEVSGDGWKFRGRGYIQLTGKNNYRLFGSFIGEDVLTNPDIISLPKYAALSAGWFWSIARLNEIADKGNNAVLEITKKINGGTNGYDDRLKRFNALIKL